MVFMAYMNYLINSYAMYAASAAAASTVVRSVCAAAEPLFTQKDSLGIGVGASLIGVLVVLLAPTLLVFGRDRRGFETGLGSRRLSGRMVLRGKTFNWTANLTLRTASSFSSSLVHGRTKTCLYLNVVYCFIRVHMNEYVVSRVTHADGRYIRHDAT
jgi:hypothetical protein